MDLKKLITACVELGSAKTIEALGLSSGEMSWRKARSVYGQWFVSAEREGRISPVRVEDGHTGTKWFRVVDILKLKAADSIPTEIKQTL